MSLVVKRPAVIDRGDILLVFALYPYAILFAATAIWVVGLYNGQHLFLRALTPVYKPTELVATYFSDDASSGFGLMLDWFGVAAVYIILRLTLFYNNRG